MTNQIASRVCGCARSADMLNMRNELQKTALFSRLESRNMSSKRHEQPSLPVNVAIGQSVSQSPGASGNKTTQAGYSSQQTTRSVTVSPLLTSTLIRDPRSSQPVTLDPAAINTALQALVKAQRSNPVELQPKQQTHARCAGFIIVPFF